MQKTITISIGGISFQLEEDAYHQLESYLAELKTHFAASGDSTEIISDFESRIAEKLSELPQGHTVTKAEITAVTESLGHPADFGEAAPPREAAQKKLFRSKDDQLVGGVCSGLAAYLGWDVVWVRLAFVVFTFLNGIGVAIYLVLWLVVPEAKSPAEKLRMQGEPLTVKNIEEAVKQRVAEVRSKDQHVFTRIVRAPFVVLGEGIRLLGRLLVAILRPLAAFIGGLIAIASALGMAFLTFLLITVLFNVGTPYIDPIVTALPRDLWLYLGLWGAYFTVLVPLIFLLQLGVYMAARKTIVRQAAAISLIILWIVGGAVAASSAIRLVPHVQAIVASDPRFQRTTKEFTVTNFETLTVGSSYRVSVNYGDTPRVVASGRAAAIEHMQLTQTGTAIELRDHDCALCFDGNGRVDITVTVPKLTKVTASGASEVTFTQEQTENLELNLSGASHAEITLDGAALSVELSGASDLDISGTAENISGKLSGASKIRAERTDTLESTLELSGASRVSFGDIQILTVHASGASKVTYRGTPEVEKDLSGASKVEPDEDSRYGVPDPEFYPDPVLPPTVQ